MKNPTKKRVAEIFDGMSEVRVAVMGDLMLDRYVWGKVDRISPEAPVPIIALDGESGNLGGAANVAANVGALGAKVQIFGVVGEDAEGEEICQLVEQQGFSADGIVRDAGRTTSVKTRVIAQSQHLVRIDRETVSDIGDTTEMKLLGRFGTDLNRFHAVILQDYNKGVLTRRVIKQIISATRSIDIPVGVDPKRENFWLYKNATLFKPNLRELEIALGRVLRDEASMKSAGRELIKRLNAGHLLVTRGEKGMMLMTEGRAVFIETQARRVHDVSGAGDTVIATIMTALAGGATIQEAAALANFAASVVIAEVGAVPIDRDKLRHAIQRRG